MWQYNRHGKKGSSGTERTDAALKCRDQDERENGNNKNTNHGREGYDSDAQGTEGIGS